MIDCNRDIEEGGGGRERQTLSASSDQVEVLGAEVRHCTRDLAAWDACNIDGLVLICKRGESLEESSKEQNLG